MSSQFHSPIFFSMTTGCGQNRRDPGPKNGREELKGTATGMRLSIPIVPPRWLIFGKTTRIGGVTLGAVLPGKRWGRLRGTCEVPQPAIDACNPKRGPNRERICLHRWKPDLAVGTKPDFLPATWRLWEEIRTITRNRLFMSALALKYRSSGCYAMMLYDFYRLHTFFIVVPCLR